MVRSGRTRQVCSSRTRAGHECFVAIVVLVALSTLLQQQHRITPDKETISFDYECDQKHYEILLNQLIEPWKDYVYMYWRDLSKLNAIAEYLHAIIKYAAIRVFGVKKRHKRAAFWMNKKARYAIDEKKRFRRRLQRTRDKESAKAKELKTNIKQCDKVINQCKNEAIERYQNGMEDKIQEMCEKDSKYFYYLANKATNTTSSGIKPLRKDGK